MGHIFLGIGPNWPKVTKIPDLPLFSLKYLSREGAPDPYMVETPFAPAFTTYPILFVTPKNM